MFIYKTTCLINNKIYIGQHNGKRYSYLGSGILIKSAIKKYGKNNFVREILEENIDNYELLSVREIYWIQYYDSTNRDIGYNIEAGGRLARKEISEKTRKSSTKALKGYRHTDETRMRMSISHIGIVRPDQSEFMKNNNPMQGKEHTDATKEKISLALKGKGHPQSEESKEKISAANTGHIMRDETKQILRDLSKQRWEDNDFRQMMLEKLGGWNHTDESKQKMSEHRKSNPEKHLITGQGSKRVNNESIFVGIKQDKSSGHWNARISKDGISYYLGTFKTEIDAASAYNAKAIELYGDKAKINIIEGTSDYEPENI